MYSERRVCSFPSSRPTCLMSMLASDSGNAAGPRNRVGMPLVGSILILKWSKIDFLCSSMEDRSYSPDKAHTIVRARIAFEIRVRRVIVRMFVWLMMSMQISFMLQSSDVILAKIQVFRIVAARVIFMQLKVFDILDLREETLEQLSSFTFSQLLLLTEFFDFCSGQRGWMTSGNTTFLLHTDRFHVHIRLPAHEALLLRITIFFLVLLIEKQWRGRMSRSEVTGDGQMIGEITKAWRHLMRLETGNWRWCPRRGAWLTCMVWLDLRKNWLLGFVSMLKIEMQQ